MADEQQTTEAEDDSAAEVLVLLENEIALGRRYKMAGQTLDAMCSARDEITRLVAELKAERSENEQLREIGQTLHDSNMRWFSQAMKAGAPSS